MVPKVVQDAGYTAVGLGVLAAQRLQVRRRETRARVSATIGTVTGVVRSSARPVAAHLDRVPRLPGPLGAVVDLGRDRLREALRG